MRQESYWETKNNFTDFCQLASVTKLQCARLPKIPPNRTGSDSSKNFITLVYYLNSLSLENIY